ncbi:hypothetical protein [Shewanella khirikhana]|uniref:HTH-like domain-containing protein n=1 Tax=Shewanella khirikhana TaxID=1965282 RepID=A0ABM7DR88_9GAMM|nr:hypothetical protein [Shewanella khirikhana]AZQ12211.1 hypothetical protein STH12_03147 [Shewanella khirikhana]
MKSEELAKILKEMYFTSGDGETAVSIHLFGIKYAEQIKECGVSPKQIAKLAGIPETYGTEINKGRNLAKYVAIK